MFNCFGMLVLACWFILGYVTLDGFVLRWIIRLLCSAVLGLLCAALLDGCVCDDLFCGFNYLVFV